jgi:hypothetical protein
VFREVTHVLASGPIAAALTKAEPFLPGLKRVLNGVALAPSVRRAVAAIASVGFMILASAWAGVISRAREYQKNKVPQPVLARRRRDEAGKRRCELESIAEVV